MCSGDVIHSPARHAISAVCTTVRPSGLVVYCTQTLSTGMLPVEQHQTLWRVSRLVPPRRAAPDWTDDFGVSLQVGCLSGRSVHVVEKVEHHSRGWVTVC